MFRGTIRLRRVAALGSRAVLLLALVGGAGWRLGRWLDPTARWKGVPRWCATGEARPSALLPFEYVDQDGRTVTDGMLHGHVTVADTIFTSCGGVCPTLTARMVWLQHQLREPTARFLSFSIDPARDRPSVLKAYAERSGGDQGRWLLLATDGTLPRVAAALGLGAPGPDGTNAAAHSERFALITADGRVRDTYDAFDPRELRRLVADARGELTSSEPARPSSSMIK
jgi:cytochrome oxidase Cu insertion factor (SCO1/SenC/PrrC family)